MPSWPMASRPFIYEDHRFDGMKVLGVDVHVWRHTRKSEKYVSVIVVLT